MTDTFHYPQALVTAIADNQQDWSESAQATSFDASISASTAAEKDGARVDNGFSALITSLDTENTTLEAESGNLEDAAKPLIREGEALSQRAAALGVQVSLRNVTEP